MAEQILKLHIDFFEDALRGRKTSEYRMDDRGYAVGDVLVLQEFDPSAVRPLTGREVRRRVTHVLTHAAFPPLREGWVVLSHVPD